MNKEAVIDRIKQTAAACESQRLMYNRLFLLVEQYDGRPVTKKFAEELAKEVSEYNVEFVFSKGYEKAVTFYPKNGKSAYQSYRFRIVYIPHTDNVNFEAFKEAYDDQRHFNHMRLMQLKQFLLNAESDLDLIDLVLNGVRERVAETKSVIRSFKYMSDLLDQDDRELIKAMGSI